MQKMNDMPSKINEMVSALTQDANNHDFKFSYETIHNPELVILENYQPQYYSYIGIQAQLRHSYVNIKRHNKIAAIYIVFSKTRNEFRFFEPHSTLFSASELTANGDNFQEDIKRIFKLFINKVKSHY